MLASVHKHTELVIDSFRHVQPMKLMLYLFLLFSRLLVLGTCLAYCIVCCVCSPSPCILNHV